MIGNGQSRKNLVIKSKFTTFGCNAIHRDFSVDHLICCDKRMVREAMSSGSFPIYTRKRWYKDFNHNQVLPFPELPYRGNAREDDPFHWGSGPYAVLMGAMHSNDVTLVGFDLYSKDKKVNNIYKDTVNYLSSDKHAIDPRYWIYQISKIFQYFPDVKFTLLNNTEWELPKSWHFDNVILDKLPNRI